MRSLLTTLLIAASCSLISSAHGQLIQKTQSAAKGATILSGSISTRVEIWNEGVIRVTHRPQSGLPFPQSLTVIARPKTVQWSQTEKDGVTVLTTPKVIVQIEKSTGRVSFFNSKGGPILQEAEHGTEMTPSSVGSATETLSITQRFALNPQEAIYGLGQHPETGAMDYVGTTVELWQKNTKVAIPVLLSSKGYALLWDNPAVTQVDVAKTDKSSVAWHSEAGVGVDYYFFAGTTPDESIAGYRWLTGAAPMFAKWTWGFWQSRERYKTQEEILGIVSEYRKRGIPLDGIIQDWQFWAPLNNETAENGWGSHEFDKARYPDPAAMFKQVHGMNAHMMVVSWAKFDVTNKGVSIPNLKALEAVGGVYEPAIPYAFPKGLGKWYDPFNDKARQVYWNLMSKHLFHLGVDAWWLDASEAELSGKWGEFRTFKTGKGPGPLVFNAYPLEHTRAVYEGERAENSAKRVFLLTRSAYAGQQRNAAVTWSGDIRGSWEVFQKQIPAGLNFTASGIPYWNTDIGGFFGSNPDDPKYVELFTRWVQFGAFCPMFRVHGTDKPKEVWRFDEATQKRLTDSINLRYHLLPYIYSVSWKVTHEGYTMMRPLVMDFQNDTVAQHSTDQFMFGPALLVNPVTQPGASTRQVWLPEGTKWVDFWSGKSYEGGQKIDAAAPIDILPLFVRAGSILPYGPAVQYASEKPNAPVELRVYRGADGSFTLYDDEGDNYHYEHGAYATIPIHWDENHQVLSIGARQGQYPGMPRERIFRIVWVAEGKGAGIASVERADREVKYAGSAIEVKAP